MGNIADYLFFFSYLTEDRSSLHYAFKPRIRSISSIKVNIVDMHLVF